MCAQLYPYSVGRVEPRRSVAAAVADNEALQHLLFKNSEELARNGAVHCDVLTGSKAGREQSASLARRP